MNYLPAAPLISILTLALLVASACSTTEPESLSSTAPDTSEAVAGPTPSVDTDGNESSTDKPNDDNPSDGEPSSDGPLEIRSVSESDAVKSHMQTFEGGGNPGCTSETPGEQITSPTITTFQASSQAYVEGGFDQPLEFYIVAPLEICIAIDSSIEWTPDTPSNFRISRNDNILFEGSVDSAAVSEALEFAEALGGVNSNGFMYLSAGEVVDPGLLSWAASPDIDPGTYTFSFSTPDGLIETEIPINQPDYPAMRSGAGGSSKPAPGQTIEIEYAGFAADQSSTVYFYEVGDATTDLVGETSFVASSSGKGAVSVVLPNDLGTGEYLVLSEHDLTIFDLVTEEEAADWIFRGILDGVHMTFFVE